MNPLEVSNPSPRVSSKYQFISSAEIVEVLGSAGFHLRTHTSKGTRTGENAPYQKHMMRFQPDILARNVGDSIPEIVVVNAHDASSRFSMFGGVYRVVCSNGMVIGNDIFRMNRMHMGSAAADVRETVQELAVTVLPSITEKVSKWLQIQLDEAQKVRLAVAALALRYSNHMAPIGPEELLTVRRLDDKSSDLWTVMNVIQENCMKGGVQSINRNTLYHLTTRPITALEADIRINTGVWAAAEKMAMELSS